MKNRPMALPPKVVLALLACSFAGCLDVTERIKLQPDGAGSVRISIAESPVLADVLRQKVSIRVAQVRNVIPDGRPIHQEGLTISTVSDLQLEEDGDGSQARRPGPGELEARNSQHGH
jgi:hypothetical protein